MKINLSMDYALMIRSIEMAKLFFKMVGAVIGLIFAIIAYVLLVKEFPTLYSNFFDNLVSVTPFSAEILRPLKYVLGFVLLVTLFHFLRLILCAADTISSQASEKISQPIDSKELGATTDHNMKNYVKTLALFQLFCLPAFVAIDVSFSELNLYSADYLATMAVVDDPFEKIIISLALLALLVHYLIAYIQLYRLKPSGRFFLTLAVAAGMFFYFMFMADVHVLSSIMAVFTYIISMVGGALMMLIYFTDSRRCFDSKA